MNSQSRTALLALALCAAGAAQAGRFVDIDIVDRHGQGLLPEFQQRGQTFVPGSAGNEFSVVLRNTSGERVMAVLSVDGVNAITGQTAATQQAGYVLNPWESVTIDGWRKSMQQTAAFYFTDLPDSYAARTGRPQNVGVIGVAVFRERDYPNIPRWNEGRRHGQDRPAWNPAERSAPAGRMAERDQGRYPPASAPAPSAGAGVLAEESRAKRAQPTDSLGTGHGRQEWNPVEYTEFQKRTSRADEVVSIRYDSWPNLVAAGVIPRGIAWRQPQPQPFRDAGFVPDPY